MMDQLPVLVIVVPCYNEEEILPETIRQLTVTVGELCGAKKIDKNSKILFVDDGSNDRTWNIIAMASLKNPYVAGIKLSRNVGHQNALLAGMFKALETCDCVITMDADLQDDVRALHAFIEKYQEGYDIVYGVRSRRDSDSFFKRKSAEWYYGLLKRFGIPLVSNHADFRLMSRRALLELSRYTETNLFLRGIIPLLGLPSTKVYYERKKRKAGKTKYPLKKMLSFALDGITSFTVVPIRMITILGFALFFLSIVALSYAMVQKFLGATSKGWTSLIISIWLIGGLQLVAIGTIGEYIGKIFSEVKGRPKYFIEIDLFSKPFLKEIRRNEENLPAKGTQSE
jgi:glycosyltransferase involved in cell wall biosynthesis